MSIRQYKFFWIPCILILIISCKKYSLDELSSAPEQIQIDGRVYILETDIYRDWNPEYTYPIRGTVSVIASDSLTFPATVDVDIMWIVHENDGWEAEQISDAEPPGEDFELKKIIEGNGADWDFDDSVDVVVHLIVDNVDTGYLLRAANQVIGLSY